jgi:hypothetical protein
MNVIGKLALAVAAPLALAGALGATMAFAQTGNDPAPTPAPNQAPANPGDDHAGCPNHDRGGDSQASQSSVSSDQY